MLIDFIDTSVDGCPGHVEGQHCYFVQNQACSRAKSGQLREDLLHRFVYHTAIFSVGALCCFLALSFEYFYKVFSCFFPTDIDTSLELEASQLEIAHSSHEVSCQDNSYFLGWWWWFILFFFSKKKKKKKNKKTHTHTIFNLILFFQQKTVDFTIMLKSPSKPCAWHCFISPSSKVFVAERLSPLYGGGELRFCHNA